MLTVLLAGIVTQAGVCVLMCGRHSRAEGQRHCGQTSKAMPAMAHDHSAMDHSGVEALDSALVSRSCGLNCVTTERLNVSRKVVPQMTVVKSGPVVLDTTAEFLPPDDASAW